MSVLTKMFLLVAVILDVYDNNGNTTFSVYGSSNTTTTTFSRPNFVGSKSSSTWYENNFRSNLRDGNSDTYWEVGSISGSSSHPDDRFDRSQSIESSVESYFYDTNGSPPNNTATLTHYTHGNTNSTDSVLGEWVQYEYDSAGVLGNVEIALVNHAYAAKDITILGSNSSSFDWSDATKWYKLAEINSIPQEKTAHTYNIPKTNIGTAIDGPEESGTSKITPFHHINTAYKHFRFVVTKSRGNFAHIAQLLLHFTTEPLFIKNRVSSSWPADSGHRSNLRDFDTTTFWESGNTTNYKTGDDNWALDRIPNTTSETYFYVDGGGTVISGSATRTYYNSSNSFADGEWVQYEYDKSFIIDNIYISVDGGGNYGAKNITILGSNHGFGWEQPAVNFASDADPFVSFRHLHEKPNQSIWYKLAEINDIPKDNPPFTFTIPKANFGTTITSSDGNITPFVHINLPFKYFRFIVTASRGAYARISELRINYTQSYTTETVAKIANIEYLIANNITAPYIQYLSDSRIKNDITLVDDTKAIDIVNTLESKEYGYIDPYNKKAQKTIGFIAQEVRDVLPNAVSIQKGFIPDEIREIVNPVWNASSDGSWTLTISDILFQSNHTGKCRFYFGETKKDIQVETNRVSFKFDRKWDNVYLWGKEINDFHMIDKNQIFALHHSAIQELSRRNDEKSAKILVLEESNEEKQQKLIALEESNEEKQQKLIALEDRISAVEKLLQETTTLQNNTQETQNTESTSLFQKV